MEGSGGGGAGGTGTPARTALAAGAIWMLVIHFVDMYWLVMPALHPGDLKPHALDFTTLLAVGGFFGFVVSRTLVNHPLIPVGDPRLAESIGFENA